MGYDVERSGHSEAAGGQILPIAVNCQKRQLDVSDLLEQN